MSNQAHKHTITLQAKVEHDLELLAQIEILENDFNHAGFDEMYPPIIEALSYNEIEDIITQLEVRSDDYE